MKAADLLRLQEKSAKHDSVCIELKDYVQKEFKVDLQQHIN